LPRLSELMEPATTNIDAAADFAAEGKIKEAQECYRAAISALNRIEAENPERAATPEFATVRNKRAYISAALDAMLLSEARENAKAVAVTDTTELEKKMLLKPWLELQPTFVALTNADRLVSKRIARLERLGGAALFSSVTDTTARAACAAAWMGLQKGGPSLASRRDALLKAYRSASGSVMRLERVAATLGSSGGVRVFDICKKDARRDIAACQQAWPPFGEELGKAGARLEELSAALPDSDAVREAFGDGPDPEVPQKERDDGLVKDGGEASPKIERQVDAYVEQERKRAAKVANAATEARTKRTVQKQVSQLLKEDPKSRKARMMMAGEDLRNGDTAAAKAKVVALLKEKPGDGPALNMRAAIEAAEGDLRSAEKTLDEAIRLNPRDHHGYYNMANIYLQKGNRDGARRYYETGRSFAGPPNAELEKAVTSE